MTTNDKEPTAHPAILTIADEIQGWLDWHAREFLPEQLTDDQHVYAMPVYPTRGTLKNWIAALKTPTAHPDQMQKLLTIAEKARVYFDGYMQDEAAEVGLADEHRCATLDDTHAIAAHELGEALKEFAK